MKPITMRKTNMYKKFHGIFYKYIDVTVQRLVSSMGSFCYSMYKNIKIKSSKSGYFMWYFISYTENYHNKMYKKYFKKYSLFSQFTPVFFINKIKSKESSMLKKLYYLKNSKCDLSLDVILIEYSRIKCFFYLNVSSSQPYNLK